METSVNQKYLRISVRKVKGLARAICGMNAKSALEKLTFGGNKASRILSKALKSALSNAKNNNKLDASSMIVKNIHILKGPAFKRWQPVSRGMAHPIKKRTTHIKIILTEAKKEVKKIEEQKEVNKEEVKNEKLKISVKGGSAKS